MYNHSSGLFFLSFLVFLSLSDVPPKSPQGLTALMASFLMVTAAVTFLQYRISSHLASMPWSFYLTSFLISFS